MHFEQIALIGPQHEGPGALILPQPNAARLVRAEGQGWKGLVLLFHTGLRVDRRIVIGRYHVPRQGIDHGVGLARTRRFHM